jgi:hypothetical protein
MGQVEVQQQGPGHQLHPCHLKQKCAILKKYIFSFKRRRHICIVDYLKVYFMEVFCCDKPQDILLSLRYYIFLTCGFSQETYCKIAILQQNVKYEETACQETV